MNKVQLIGRLGDNPEVRTTPTGQMVATVSLATNEVFKDKDGNKATTTEWHKLVFWGALADIVSQYTTKGQQIFVEGKIKTRSYLDKNDNKQSVTEIIVKELELLGSKNNPLIPENINK